MNDGARIYPVDKLIMHHAVSDEMENWDDLAVQDWFSAVGKSRGYNSGALNPLHEHPGRPEELTYSMAHYCLHKYTLDGNKYGWRLTELIKNPFQQVAWHSGNWDANTTSIGIETAGNYLDHPVDERALMLVADTLGRPWDQELVDAGYSNGVGIYGHKDWYATECPAQIYEELGSLIDMINDPSTWEDKLFSVAMIPEWRVMDTPRLLRTAEQANVIDLDTMEPIGAPILAGVDTPFVDMKTQDGLVYLRSAWSHSNAKNWGVESTKLIEVPPPVVEPPLDPSNEPTEPSTPSQSSDYDEENNTILKRIEKMLTDLWEAFKKIFNIGAK